MERICSRKRDIFQLKVFFRKSGYPQDLVNKETNKEAQTYSLGCAKTSERNLPGNGGTGVPLVIKQSPFPERYGQVIRKSLYFLQRNEAVQSF